MFYIINLSIQILNFQEYNYKYNVDENIKCFGHKKYQFF